MKKKTIALILVLVTLATLLVGCSNRPKTDRKLEKLIDEYVVNIQEDGETYFNELVNTVTGNTLSNVAFGFRYTTKERMKEDPKPLDEILAGNFSTLLVGLNKSSNGAFTDEEIHDILVEAHDRGLIADFYFNYDDYYVYELREDGVEIDETLAEDGGAMHRKLDYEL